MSIIDCHVYLEGNVLPGVNQTPVQLTNLLTNRGIDRAVVLSARAAQVDPLSGNRILKASLDQSPSLYGCLVTHTNRVEASLQAIKESLGARKFVAVLLTGPDPNVPLQPLLADEILNACRRYQKPIFLYAPNPDCVQAAFQLAKTYSMHKFVLLGMGGEHWQNGIIAAQQATNIFLETSGALDRAKIAAAVTAVGPHRVLFGSGLPALDPAAALGLVKDSGISNTEQRRLLFDNADRLLGIADNE